MGQYTSSYKNNTNRSLIYAVSASLIEIDRELKMAEGRFFTDREDKAQAKVVVLGPEVKKNLFGEEDAVGKNLKINRVNFKVIGVTEPRGSYTYMNFDKMIYMPIITAQKQMMGIDHVMFGFLTLNDTSRTEETVAEMTTIMRRRHGLPPNEPDKDDFRITSMREAMDMVGTITSAMTLLVLVIAGISLVVGGVGIMNVMYLSVVERTREIGLRKAIGASNGLIKTQFLLEAVIITGLGGVIGVIFGGGLVVLIDTIARTQGYDFGMTITWDAILTALAAAIIFGVLFGLYPARKAAGLSPVEALRYE
jgi:ABC-type antimicrobial peptide transport system permease subunit